MRGSSSRLTACSQASWVAWRMVNRKLRRWSTSRAGKLRRRAGCPAASGPGWKLPRRRSSSQTSAVVAGSSKASAVDAHPVPAPAGGPVDLGPEPQALRGGRGGEGQLVGLAVVGRLEAADPGRRRAVGGRAADRVGLAQQHPATVAGEPHPDGQAVVLGLDRPGSAERLVEPVEEGLTAGDGGVEGGQARGRDRPGPRRDRRPEAVDHGHHRARDHGRGQGPGDQQQGQRTAPQRGLPGRRLGRRAARGPEQGAQAGRRPGPCPGRRAGRGAGPG